MSTLVDRVVHLSEERARKLEQIAQAGGTTEDALIERALDLLFDSTVAEERAAWAALSQPALQRVWDNDADAVYDDWRTLYGIPTG